MEDPLARPGPSSYPLGMVFRLLAAAIVVMAAYPGAVRSGEVNQTVSAEGRCEILVIAGEDRSSDCGTPLLAYRFAYGRRATAAGTGGKAMFGLASPEDMLMFAGAAAESSSEWSDYAVDQVLITPASAPAEAVRIIAADGASAFEAQEGHKLLVHCVASDADGKRYELRYLTDTRTRIRF